MNRRTEACGRRMPIDGSRTWPPELTCSAPDCGRAIPCRHHPDAPTMAQRGQNTAQDDEQAPNPYPHRGQAKSGGIETINHGQEKA